MKDTKLPAQTVDTSLKVARRGDVVIAAIEKIPPQAILSVVDIIADVARSTKAMEESRLDFEQTLTTLREKHMDRKERMAMLAGLLRELNLAEKAQAQLVESICRIAEGS